VILFRVVPLPIILSICEGDKISGMGRKKREDYVCGEPVVFSSVVAGPELEREWQELQKFKISEDEEVSYEVLRLRKASKERDDKDKARYGEEGFKARQETKRAIGRDLVERIRPVAEAAKLRGFVYFQCRPGPHYDGLELQFADGKGTYFRRSIRLNRFADKHRISLDWQECFDIASALEHAVKDIFEMGYLDHGMTAKRVRATTA